jgi:hypothetical protein
VIERVSPKERDVVGEGVQTGEEEKPRDPIMEDP